MNKILLSILLAGAALPASAHTVRYPVTAEDLASEMDTLSAEVADIKTHLAVRDRIHLGGYGEATYNYDFSSVRVGNSEALYQDAKSHGSLTLPRVVVMLGANLGKGWGIETDVQIENCKSVSLDQFWIEKLFTSAAGLRVGYLTLPVGATNAHDDPLEFFAVNRPEGEDGILPCDWHQAGVSFFGEAGSWNYEAILIPGLATTLFSEDDWMRLDGEGSNFEFSRGSDIAFAGRVYNYSVKGLRLGLSGYYGVSTNNRISFADGRRERIRGNVGFLSADFLYDDFGWVLRGYGSWGRYSKYCKENGVLPDVFSHHAGSKSAFTASFEGGYDILRLAKRGDDDKGKLYIFGRYDYWQPNEAKDNFLGYEWGERQRVTAGLNYFPIERVVIKAEYSHTFVAGGGRIPMVSLGVAYSAQFF